MCWHQNFQVSFSDLMISHQYSSPVNGHQGDRSHCGSWQAAGSRAFYEWLPWSPTQQEERSQQQVGLPVQAPATWMKLKWLMHHDVIKWKHFLCYWPFVWGIHCSPVNSPHKGHWHGALMCYLICPWINGQVINREAGDLRHHHAYHDATVMAD